MLFSLLCGVVFGQEMDQIISLNEATYDELILLDGWEEEEVIRFINYRNEFGPIYELEELRLIFDDPTIFNDLSTNSIVVDHRVVNVINSDINELLVNNNYHLINNTDGLKLLIDRDLRMFVSSGNSQFSANYYKSTLDSNGRFGIAYHQSLLKNKINFTLGNYRLSLGNGALLSHGFGTRQFVKLNRHMKSDYFFQGGVLEYKNKRSELSSFYALKEVEIDGQNLSVFGLQFQQEIRRVKTGMNTVVVGNDLSSLKSEFFVNYFGSFTVNNSMLFGNGYYSLLHLDRFNLSDDLFVINSFEFRSSRRDYSNLFTPFNDHIYRYSFSSDVNYNINYNFIMSLRIEGRSDISNDDGLMLGDSYQRWKGMLRYRKGDTRLLYQYSNRLKGSSLQGIKLRLEQDYLSHQFQFSIASNTLNSKRSFLWFGQYKYYYEDWRIVLRYTNAVVPISSLAHYEYEYGLPYSYQFESFFRSGEAFNMVLRKQIKDRLSLGLRFKWKQQEDHVKYLINLQLRVFW